MPRCVFVGCCDFFGRNLVWIDARCHLSVCVSTTPLRLAGRGQVLRSICYGMNAQVHQLVSTIQGQKRAELSSVDVFRATFPMGSMTGAPKRRSLALLDALEADARGIYSGAIGFFSLNGAIHFSVAIRTAVVTGYLPSTHPTHHPTPPPCASLPIPFLRNRSSVCVQVFIL